MILSRGLHRKKRFLALSVLPVVVSILVVLFTPRGLAAQEIGPLPAPKAIQASADSPLASKAIGAETANLSNLSERAARGFLYALGLLLALLAVHKKLRRGNSPAPGTAIEVIARKSVTPKHSLVVVRVEGQRMLLGLCAESMQLLSKLPEGQSFAAELNSYMDEAGDNPLEVVSAGGR